MGSDAKEGSTTSVYRRQATGLVREMSAFDIAWWGIAGTGGLYLLFYFMPYAQEVLPGANLGLAIALCLLVMIPLYALYAAMGSAMPRAGGDYVYQSRILHPSIGFAFPFSWFTIVWIAVFVAFGGFVVANLGLAPVFLLLGAEYGNASFSSFATWVQSATGNFVVSFAIGLLSLIITIYPMKWWTAAQRYVFFPFTTISTLVLIYLFGTASGASFHSALNYWGDLLGTPGLYEKIVSATNAASYVTPSFSLYNTILLTSVISIYLAWTMWSAQGLMAEVKRAGDLRRLFSSYLGAGLFLQWFVLFIPIILFQNVIGWDFSNRIAQAYYLPNSVVPFYPTVGLLASMLTTNPVLIILVSLGIMAGGFFIAASEFVIVTRIWIAMSLDRSLPGWFGNVSERTHTPVQPTILCMVVSIIAAYLFDFWPPFYSVVTVGSVMGPAAVAFVTSIAAFLLPIKLKSVYESSPISRHKIGGRIHLIWIISVAAAAATFAVDYIYLSAKALGYNAPVPVAFTVLILVIGFVVYAASYLYQRSRGIDLRKAFAQIPPE
jgi:basic amino acid/polyamine antiporter, APA family